MSLMQNNSSRKMDSESANHDAKKEVQQLIADGNTNVSPALLNKLRQKHSDSNLVDMIVESLSERVNTIKNRATKFARAIIKHSGQNTPLHTMLKRALKYKDRLGLSDAEFEFFKQQLHNTLGGNEDRMLGYETVNTNLSRALGNVDVENYEGVNVEQSDYPYLQEIIKLHAVTKPLHSNIVIQSMLYEPFSAQAITGAYSNTKDNPACHVHPIVAAFFLPKIALFEETFLLANIAYIVRCRYEKTKVMTGPDYLLLYSLISDPNDVVCDLESPFKDLRQRVVLQQNLWESVYNLRNGRHYNCNNAQFMAAIDGCKLNNADAPDVIYIGDEATILRRLLQAFSFRPIIVSTIPVFGVVTANTPNLPVMMNRVTAIPMITVRLPVGIVKDDDEQVDLEDSLKKPQYFLENGNLVPKIQEIIYTRGVIIFHVTRRTQIPRYQKMVSPGNWNELLPTITSYERINKRVVTFSTAITTGSSISETPNNVHHLRSIVILRAHSFALPDLITGTASIFAKSDNTFSIYDPLAVMESPEDPQQLIRSSYTPLPMGPMGGDDDDENFLTLGEKYGTIYVYSVINRTERPPDGMP